MITIARENLKWDEKPRAYTGRELAPHWILKTFGLQGSACVAFRGPCQVDTAELVDLEDQMEGERIVAREMVHILAEFFGDSLHAAVLRQRLLVARVAEILNGHIKGGGHVARDGNDLFIGGRKLSVSIVTASPVSTLLHLGINIDPHGAPVEAIGLQEIGVDPAACAAELLEALYAEWRGVDWSAAKVRPVT